MQIFFTNGNREMLLHVLEAEIGERPVYHPAPGFVVTVGTFTLLRDGRLIEAGEPSEIGSRLSLLGLVSGGNLPAGGAKEDPAVAMFRYPIPPDCSRLPLHVISIFASRQSMLNQALSCRHAFFVDQKLMEDLAAHPPSSVHGFLQAVYGREAEYKGLEFSPSFILLSGFLDCKEEERSLQKQLADHIVKAAGEKQWVKHTSVHVRNRKYAFRIWMNAMGMVGPEYEEARAVFLSRLYGRSDQRVIPKNNK